METLQNSQSGARCLNASQAPRNLLLGYYVGNYLREEYGTPAQLERGMQDHKSSKSIPETILDRLISAWRAMKLESGELPKAYRVGGEWAPIIGSTFQPLIKALDQEDRDSLSDILQNFFRRFGDVFGEPTDVTSIDIKHRRCQVFRVFASRWLDLYGEESLPEMKNPLIGNPIGFEVDGAIFTADSFRHNFYARRIADLLSDIEKPAVLEIGGGFDGVAYHLLSRIRREFKYIDFDLPAVAILAAYFLLTAFPSMRIGLYGEVGSADPFRAYDVVIFPNFALPWLTDMSADLCFNSCSFAEMDELTVREYMRQFERICRRFIMHQNHSWVSGTRNGCYEPMGRFKHWNLSLVEPNPSIFKRVHKITSPFQGDLYAEFFEWLYERR